MSYDETLAQRIRKVFSTSTGIVQRKMFGGLAFMVNGRMFCGVIKDDLVVRVGPQRYKAALKQPHVRPMDFTGRPLTGYVYVNPPGYQSEAELAKWVESGMAFVSTMLAKKPHQGNRGTRTGRGNPCVPA